MQRSAIPFRCFHRRERRIFLHILKVFEWDQKRSDLDLNLTMSRKDELCSHSDRSNLDSALGTC